MHTYTQGLFKEILKKNPQFIKRNYTKNNYEWFPGVLVIKLVGLISLRISVLFKAKALGKHECLNIQKTTG